MTTSTLHRPALPGGALPPSFGAAFFSDVFTQQALHRVVPWGSLAGRLQRFPVRADTTDKRRLPCWSPATFRAGAPPIAASVVAVGLLVLDLDGGVGHTEALDRCAPFAALAHTTWSHRDDAPCLRLVLPLARPVPGDRWGEAWARAVDALGLPVDRPCSNANRRYLLPALPRREAPHAAEVRDADTALDLLPLLPAVEARGAAPLRVVRVPHHRVERVVRMRLGEPEVRRDVADRLGAMVRGAGDHERADGLVCPGCGRPSAWFFVAPHRATRARCKHRKSCGWTGPLTALIARAA